MCSRMDTTTSARLRASATPAQMNAIYERVCVGLGPPGVGSLSLHMLVTAVAADSHAPEANAVGGNPPGLAEQLAPRGCGLAGEAVHAAVEIKVL